MGYSPGFLLKIGQFSTLANSTEIETNSRARSQKSFQEGLGGVSESLERFPGLAKIGHVQTMGYSPGFLLKNGQISTLANSSEIDTNSCARSQKSFKEGLGSVSESLERLPGLAKIRHVQTMGYSPGFLLKNGQISTLANSSEIDTNSRARSQKSFQEGLGGVSESLERFPGLAKIGHVQNHGLQPRLFAQKRPNFDCCEFIRNRHKQLRKELEIILGGFRWRFREFGAISRTCQNRPCSKPWAIAQAFCSKTAKFRPFRIHPKSTQTVAQGVRNHFRRVQVAVSESLERFSGLAKIGHVQNHGLQSRLFAQKRPNFDPCEFIRNRHKQSRKELEIILGGSRKRFREFGAISRTCQNRPCSKPWAIAQAFCSKTAKFRPLRIHPKSTQTVAQGVRNHFRRVQEAFQRVWSDFQDLPKSAMFKTMGYSPGFLLKNGQISTVANSSEIDTNSCARSQKSFQEGLGGVSEVWSDFQHLPKSAMFKTMGYSPGFLLKNGQISTLANSPESTQTVAQGVRNHLWRVQEAFQRVWSDYQDLQKSAMFKPWAIAQAFCSKTAKFRPLRIHPKSTQTVAQGVRNNFRRVQVAFQRVWSDFQDLPKSAMFKTMGYSPGFLLKIGQFSTLANSTEIDTNSRARSQKSFQEGLGGVSESLERFPGLAKIGHVQNHGLQPRLFAQKRPNFDPCEFIRNRHKQSCKELEIILRGFSRRFREF